MQGISPQPLISAIITTCNRPVLFRRALSSVVSQTYPNLEIIVVDNGNTPALSAEELKQLCGSKKSNYIRLNTPVGGSKARNIGLQHAQGEYIAFLDDDDEWFAEKITKQIQAILKSTNLRTALVTSDYIKKIPNGNSVLVRISPNQSLGNAHSLYMSNTVGSTSAPLIRKEFVVECNGFDESLKSCQDWDMWIRLSVQYGDILYIDEPLLCIHESSTGRISTSIKNRLSGQMHILIKHWRLFKPSIRAFHVLRLQQTMLEPWPTAHKVSKMMGQKIRILLNKLSGVSYVNSEVPLGTERKL